ncbi:MAG TPA: argininosuccinate synthase [Caulobacterales bacterium]|nr:argininosuccinate synthase [Caulobacterales bacterium]
MATQKSVKKVVLAYSGGLDTSIILKWLQETYHCEVVTFTADLGQGEELAPAREKALAAGVKPENIFIEDLREEFVRDYVFPMFRANTLYEGLYLLGTSIARPLIAKKQIEIANMVGADAVCHGATGKGNDQVRFEVSYYALKPDVTVIAPWREWEFQGRPDLIAYAKKHGIKIAQGKEQDAPFSIDANLLHTSSEGLVLEDPEVSVPDLVSKRADRRTITPEEAPDKATIIEVGFERGDAVSLRILDPSPLAGEGREGGRAGSSARSESPPPPAPSPQGGGEFRKLSPAALLTELNRLGKENGIGGLDLVENRYVGMKSRGYYETPGGTILWNAHRAIESITLDRGAMHLKDELMPKYASLIYNGMWFTPEREMLQAAIDKSQDYVAGTVKLKLYKGGVSTIGRSSPYSLYSKKLVGFDEAGGYNQADAEGFIKLNALRLRILAERDRKAGKND